MTDEYFMNLALQLAESVYGQTTPNPPVGAVIVKNGAIVGVGLHMKSGQAHAEVLALEMAKEEAKGATMYVTLEPCSHIGKTPPCADLIIEYQLSRVVIASIDQHERVEGKGIKKLIDNQIEVECGVLSERAHTLYSQFFNYINNKLPYVTMKVAMTLDGKTATENGESKWITSEAARKDVHQYRHKHDAILVGIGTVLADNPRLTTRLPYGRNPVRVILDTHLRTPLDANIVTDNEAATWIFVNKYATKERISAFQAYEQVRIIVIEEVEVHVQTVLEYLGEEEITSVFVEGGATVHGAFLTSGYVNEFICYIAPKIIGNNRAKGAVEATNIERITDAYQLEITSVDIVGDDIKVITRKEDE